MLVGHAIPPVAEAPPPFVALAALRSRRGRERCPMSQPSVQSLPALWPFKRVYYGWGVVAASVAMSFAQVPVYGPVLSVFLTPINQDLGWSFGQMSLAFAGGSLLGSLLSPVVGARMDRYGARSAVVVSGLLVSTAMIGLAFVQEIWQFIILFAIGRTAALAGVNLGSAVAIANWFVRSRGRATSFLSIGLRAGQAIVPLAIITPIMLSASWRHAYAALAALTFVLIVVPGWLFIRRRPEDFGLLPDGASPQTSASPSPGSAPPHEEFSFTLREARRTAAFWLLTFATMSVAFAQTAVNVHAVTSIVDRGISQAFSGAFVFIMMGVAALSAYGWGALIDLIHVRWAAAIATVLSGSAMLLLMAVDSLGMAIAFAVLFGLGTGGWTLAQTLVFANYFGRRSLGSIRGVSQMLGGPLSAMGAVIAGYIRDYTDSYTLSFAIFFGALALVFVALLFARPPRNPPRLAPEKG